MTSRCCRLIQPARATRTNCSGCDSDGTAASLSDAEFFEALDRRSEVDRVFGHYRFGFISLEAPFFPLRQFFQSEAAADVEVETSPAGWDQPHEVTTLIQTAPQQDQPRFQVVFDVR